MNEYFNNIFIKKIIDFYVFSNIHVAFATFCLVKITLLNIGVSENMTAWFVFFSTLVSYNIIRFLRFKNIKTWYHVWIKNNRALLYSISVISALIIIYLSFNLRLKAILVLIPFALTVFFYTSPLKHFSLRNIPGLKLFLIAFSWAGITVLFPLIQNYITPRIIDWITFFQRFLFVVVITIPFDIRDLSFDNTQLKTIPQQFGIKKSKLFGILLLILFISLEFIKPSAKNVIVQTLIITILSGLLLWFSNNNQSKYYSSFLVESLPITWLVILLLL